MASAAPAKTFSLIPPPVTKFLSRNLPPKTLQYFSILLLLRTLLGRAKIRRRSEDLAYILFFEPAVLTLMHAGGRSRWPFSTKYRVFLDRGVWPAGVSPRYEKLHGCEQFHPGTDACAASMVRDAPITMRNLVKWVRGRAAAIDRADWRLIAGCT
ncbi:hypothetical protein DFJ74DRAFT_684951 [Hyaloraphidium curvatum]|nr:hypothetical protein DFJ74DRAFT_684951 [Hyaloraphidium curvatum]